MRTISNDIDLAALYSKAKAAFKKSIENKENGILQSETDVPLDGLQTTEEWIRIQFSGLEKSNFEIEVRLDLTSPDGVRLGYYCYHENESGEHIDDYLVFE